MWKYSLASYWKEEDGVGALSSPQRRQLYCPWAWTQLQPAGSFSESPLLHQFNSFHFSWCRVETRGFTAQLLPHGFRNITDIECVRWVFSSLEEIHHDRRNQLWLWCLCTASTPSGTWRPKGGLWDFVKNSVRILIGHLMRKKYLNSQRTRDRRYICGLMFKLMCKLMCKLKTCWSQVLS